MRRHRQHESDRQTAHPTLLRRAAENVRRAFAEFLTIPTLIIGGFLLLSAGMYELDQVRLARGWPALVAVDHQAVRTFLGTIATSIITVTSITFSLLLVAVQQGASSLTAQVYDQFLRRRANQAYFGFFTGLALYSLLILAMTHPGYTPVYSAILAFLLTVVALYLLILLIYSTIDQMRPVMIVQNIRDHTIGARERQRALLERTRPAGVREADGLEIRAQTSGYVASIDIGKLEQCGGRVHLLRSLGDYVSLGEPLAIIEASALTPDCDAIRRAIGLEEQRDLDRDAAFGIEQLSTIAWTSTSTSKSNPHPGKLACWNLRDLIACWYPVDGPDTVARCRTAAIAYPDNVPDELLAALESITVVSSESMQHQTQAAAYRSLALAARRMPAEWRRRIEDIVDRSLSALGDHVLTKDLDDSIGELAAAMRETGMSDAHLTAARNQLARSIGHLANRANRSMPDQLP